MYVGAVYVNEAPAARAARSTRPTCISHGHLLRAGPGWRRGRPLTPHRSPSRCRATAPPTWARAGSSISPTATSTTPTTRLRHPQHRDLIGTATRESDGDGVLVGGDGERSTRATAASLPGARAAGPEPDLQAAHPRARRHQPELSPGGSHAADHRSARLVQPADRLLVAASGRELPVPARSEQPCTATRSTASPTRATCRGRARLAAGRQPLHGHLHRRAARRTRSPTRIHLITSIKEQGHESGKDDRNSRGWHVGPCSCRRPARARARGSARRLGREHERQASCGGLGLSYAACTTPGSIKDGMGHTLKTFTPRATPAPTRSCSRPPARPTPSSATRIRHSISAGDVDGRRLELEIDKYIVVIDHITLWSDPNMSTSDQ